MNVFAQLLEHENNRGINAVINALKEIGIITEIPELNAIQFKEMKVGIETLNKMIEEHLK